MSSKTLSGAVDGAVDDGELSTLVLRELDSEDIVAVSYWTEEIVDETGERYQNISQKYCQEEILPMRKNSGSKTLDDNAKPRERRVIVFPGTHRIGGKEGEESTSCFGHIGRRG